MQTVTRTLGGRVCRNKRTRTSGLGEYFEKIKEDYSKLTEPLQVERS